MCSPSPALCCASNELSDRKSCVQLARSVVFLLLLLLLQRVFSWNLSWCPQHCQAPVLRLSDMRLTVALW